MCLPCMLSTSNKQTPLKQHCFFLASSARPENGTTYDDYDTDSSTLKDLYESAMRDVTNTPFNETVSFSTSVAEKANFTEYCQFALPGTCTNYYEETLPKDENILGLIMNFGKHFQVRLSCDRMTAAACIEKPKR